MAVQRYRARWVFPMTGPPIPGGVVAVADGRIVDVGPHRHAPAIDLGDVALLPGLVNVHTHLEFSLLPHPLGSAGTMLHDWIPRVIDYRRSVESTSEALSYGLAESWQCGVRWLGEIATPGWQPGPFGQSPLGGVVFAELLGPREQDIEPQLARAVQHLQRHGALGGRWQTGLAPHAPYTVHPQLFGKAVDLAQAAGTPFAFHLAESLEELEYLRTGAGALQSLLESRGVWQAGAIPPETRPIDYLRPMARLSRALVIHGNYLDALEQAFLADNAHRIALVYCPRTHASFGHAPYPLGRLLAEGVRVVLGTDGRASNPDLNLWAELRFVCAKHADVSPRQAFAMVTSEAAIALGLPEAGVLRSGVPAQVLALPMDGRERPDPFDALVEAPGPPQAAW